MQLSLAVTLHFNPGLTREPVNTKQASILPILPYALPHLLTVIKLRSLRHIATSPPPKHLDITHLFSPARSLLSQISSPPIRLHQSSHIAIMSFLFGRNRQKTPQDLVRAVRESISRLDVPLERRRVSQPHVPFQHSPSLYNTEKQSVLFKASEEVSRLLAQMKVVLQGNAGPLAHTFAIPSYERESTNIFRASLLIVFKQKPTPFLIRYKFLLKRFTQSIYCRYLRIIYRSLTLRWAPYIFSQPIKPSSSLSVSLPSSELTNHSRQIG